MNVFEAVKQSVTTRQAAEHYGIHVGRNGKLCEEETFAAEEDVSKAFDRLNFIFYGFLERNDISCINFDHFARCELFQSV